MFIRFYAFLYLVSILVACSNPDPNPTDVQVPNPPNLPPLSPIKVAGEPFLVKIAAPTCRVYAAAHPDSLLIETLAQNDTVLFLNEVSGADFEQEIGGILYREPLLKVVLPNRPNGTGWVYAPEVHFLSPPNPELIDLTLQKRAKQFFKPHIAQTLSIYKDELSTMSTLAAFGLVWERAEWLKDSMQNALNQAFASRLDSTKIPDFLWVNYLLEGHLLHWIQAENRYFLFKDLGYWLRKAQTTADMGDDAMIQAKMRAFASDSIEYLYPDWQLVDEHNQVFSLLGKGIHTRMLNGIDSALTISPFFGKILQTETQKCLKDILDAQYYWQPAPEVLAELAQILAQPHLCLQQNDKIALQARLRQLQNPELHQIRLNCLEGI